MNKAYDDISSIIEELVAVKCRKYATGYISYEDIAQEVRIKCWKVMGRYDEKFGKLKPWLNVVTENHLKNLIRDKFCMFTPPKRRNPEYFDAHGTPTQKALNDPKVRSYLVAYDRKKSIKRPLSIDGKYESAAEGVRSSAGSFEAIDLDISIREILQEHDDALLETYEKILVGAKVKPIERLALQNAIRELNEKG